ncbi:hypothetical protein SFRURICE_003096 [Spodoptera frugiperda]|nr:hypothetical protein SFRURICE_003096 [Spodoptera frugiperda]
MNFCVVSVQIILVAIFVVQSHYGFEVEADTQSSQAVGSWFNSIERKVNVQDMMTGVYGKIKKTANDFVEFPSRLIDYATGTNPNTNDIDEDNDLSTMVNSQEQADLYVITSFETRASEVSSDEAKNEPEPDTEVVKEVKHKPKRKKKIKKRKKNRRKKKHHPLPPPAIQEIRPVTSAEVQRAEFGSNKLIGDGDYQNIKPRRNLHNLHNVHNLHKKKFVKAAVKDVNTNSESDETKTKPVDIIVHIKMND